MTATSSANWLRANLIGEICLNDALQAVLHNDPGDLSYVGLPRNGIDLHREMTNFMNSPDGRLLTRRRIIRQCQWDILCPPNGTSNSGDWDITIKKVVIQYNAGLPEPIGGWIIDNPFILDVTKASHVIRAKNLRNELKHGTIKELIATAKYNDVIARIETILIGLDYQNMAFFEDLKARSLEEYTEKLVNIVKADLENEIGILKDGLNETSKAAEDNNMGLITQKADIKKLQMTVLIYINESTYCVVNSKISKKFRTYCKWN